MYLGLFGPLADILINYNSNHPSTQKYASFNSLLYRAFSLPLSYNSFVSEINIIKQLALNNDFSIKSINKKLKSLL